MAFWSYQGGAMASSTIDTILDKPAFELSELLADDELLQECKAVNARLIEYLSKPAVIDSLFTYIMVEPTSADTNERCYTFPYVSSELLSCDIKEIHEAIHSDACVGQLTRLLAFPEPAGALNPVLVGYYAKVRSFI
ncbi:hypothetical protein T492DRAFT_38782 [Pavlovales sp. CCMP2436]|nr:hypothetical protein T492DRAFT_38782 [Pavlovales sp. CCMP2436]